MKLIGKIGASLLLSASALSATAVAAQDAGASSATAATAQDAAPRQDLREREAMEALAGMGLAMRGLQTFTLSAPFTKEVVLTSGQKIQFGGTVTIMAKRPDRLRMNVVSELNERVVYYNGKTITVAAPRMGYYASHAARPTIRETATELADRLNVEMPLVDLFDWGTDSAVMERLQSAFSVGTETIAGHRCGQYAMRQEGNDWQIWIREDGPALPCKLVITTTDDPSMPQFSAVFNWTMQNALAESLFTFVPAKDDVRIVFDAERP